MEFTGNRLTPAESVLIVLVPHPRPMLSRSSAPAIRTAANLTALIWAVALGGLISALRAADATSLPAPVILSAGWRMQDVAKVSEPGAVVSSPAFASAVSGWYQATVPGTVLTTLVDNHVYPEPLYGENNRPDKIPESLSRTSYWFHTAVTVPAGYAGRHVWLNFEGINYTAEVWVNGKKAGADIRGAFTRGIFDVTPLVSPGQTAVVAVLIHPPLIPHDNPPEQTQANGTGGNGGVHSQDGAAFISSQGWDWIPAIRDRDMGIWQKVTLSATGAVVIEDPLVTSRLPLPRTDSADLAVETTLRNVTDATQSGVLRGTFEGRAFQAAVTLQPRESKLVKFTAADTPQLHLANPRLWWPNGYGKPELYSMHLSFEPAHLLDLPPPDDTRDVTFGIRELTYTLPGSDNLALSVNGVPVMARGGNWGMDEAMKRIPRERLEAQVRFHQLANVNMIRNWVGQSTGEDFYDLCDRYGIMVWDEFFEPNQSDSGRGGDNPDGRYDVRDIPMYLANVREKVLRFRNHASIVIWCGRNESNPAPQAVAAGLEQLMAELNPQRLYHPNSADGKGVRSGGPYAWRTPQSYYSGTGRGGGARGGAGAPTELGANLEPFKTELGSVSIPTLEAIQAMMPEKDWHTINDDWAEHDLLMGAQSNAAMRFEDLLARRYGVSVNLAEFTRKGQLACYESYRAMYEGRFARLFNPATGVLTWMSNPSQPSFVWQYYSWDLEPLASLYGTQKANEPLHVMMNQGNFHLMVVNQLPAASGNLTARVRVLNLDGSVRLDRTVPVNAKASAATDLDLIPFPAEGLTPVHFVKLELKDAAGKTVSDNFYWRALPANEEDYTALDTLPAAQLDAKIARHDANGKVLLDVTLSNPTNVIAVMAHLQLRSAPKIKYRVLPVYYSENFVSLLPGESRTITIEAAAKDLGGGEPVVMVDGWNVRVKDQAFPGIVGLALNHDALPGGEPRTGLLGNPARLNAAAGARGAGAAPPLTMEAIRGWLILSPAQLGVITPLVGAMADAQTSVNEAQARASGAAANAPQRIRALLTPEQQAEFDAVFPPTPAAPGRRGGPAGFAPGGAP